MPLFQAFAYCLRAQWGLKQPSLTRLRPFFSRPTPLGLPATLAVCQLRGPQHETCPMGRHGLFMAACHRGRPPRRRRFKFVSLARRLRLGLVLSRLAKLAPASRLISADGRKTVHLHTKPRRTAQDTASPPKLVPPRRGQVSAACLVSVLYLRQVEWL